MAGPWDAFSHSEAASASSSGGALCSGLLYRAARPDASALEVG